MLSGPASAAPDVSSCGVARGQVFNQDTTNFPSSPAGYVFSSFVTMNHPGSVTNAQLNWPGGSTNLASGSTTWDYIATFDSQTNLQTNFPDGLYGLEVFTRHDGSLTNLKVTLNSVGASNGLPDVPAVMNFPEAQTIDPNLPFTLVWSPPTNSPAPAFVQLRIQSQSGADIFSTPSLGMVGALSGTNNSFTVPAGILPPGTTNQAVLLFANLISRDTNAPAGMLTVGGFFRQTQFPVRTTGSPANSTPNCYSSSPRAGETDVPLNAPISFYFSQPMRLEQSIQWSTNLDATYFRYQWSADQRVLQCVYGTNLPANANISWTLSPTNGSGRFASVAGLNLNPAPVTGSFTTGTNLLGGAVEAFIVYKGQAFVQDTNNGVVPDTNAGPYRFGLSLQGNYPGDILRAWVSRPGFAPLALEGGGSDGLGLERGFTSAANRDAEFPDGAYRFTLDTAREGQVTLSNQVVTTTLPTTPRISNLAAAASLPATSDFVLTWDAFAGGTPGDFIQVQISDATGQRAFGSGEAPGSLGALNGTNVSVVIPANQLKPGQTYYGTLMFAKIYQFDTNQYPGALGITAYLKSTSFTIGTRGQPVRRETDLGSFGVAKGRAWLQTNDGPVVVDGNTPYSLIAFANQNHPGSLFAASVTPPGGAGFALQNSGGSSWNRSFSFATPTALDQTYSNGTYLVDLSLTHDGLKSGLPMVLDQPDFPSPPTLVNYAAAQALNANQACVLVWTNQDATAADFLSLSIKDAQNRDIYNSGDPGEVTALDGSRTTLTIPAGILVAGRTYSASLLLGRLNKYPNLYPGALGVCGRYSQTRFSLQTTGTTTVVPPVLIASYPANQTTNVPLNTTVTFEFSQPMARNYSVQWGGSLDPSFFSYHWTPDARKLVCNYAGSWYPNSTITWSLPGGNFSSVAGASLPGTYSGSFRLGTNETYPDLSLYLVYKSESWLQDANGNVALSTNESPFQFGAGVLTTQPFTIWQGALTPPTRPIVNMSVDGEGASAGGAFNSRAELDAAFPNGNYQMNLATAHHGAVHVTTPLTGDAYPPVPQITNQLAESFSARVGFQLGWSSFTNGTDQDFVLVRLDSPNGGTAIRTADYPGQPNSFTGTNRTLFIPAGTLQPGTSYRGSLMFAKLVARDTNSFPDVLGASAYARQTSFELNTAPELSVPQSLTPGQVRLLAWTRLNRACTLLANTNLLGTNWFPVASTNATVSPVVLIDAGATNGQRFYRLRQD